MAKLSATRSINYVVNGKDAVGYTIVPSAASVLKKANNTFDPATISATVVKSVGQTVSGNASEATLQWRTASNGAWATITKGAAQTIPSGCSLIEFKALVDGVAVATADVRVVLADQQGPAGPTGPKGAKPRFWVWSEVKAYLTGYAARHIDFQCGAAGEEYYDLMSYEGASSVTMYRCKTSFTLNGGTAATINLAAPNLSSNSSKWEAATDGWGFIATKLIMSEFGIVKNLCSEYIQCVKDGVTKFEVDRNGNVTANGGTFNNINVNGTIACKELHLSGMSNHGYATFLNDGALFQLEDAPDNPWLPIDGIGVCRTIKILALARSRTSVSKTFVARYANQLTAINPRFATDFTNSNVTLSTGGAAAAYDLVMWHDADANKFYYAFYSNLL